MDDSLENDKKENGNERNERNERGGDNVFDEEDDNQRDGGFGGGRPIECATQ